MKQKILYVTSGVPGAGKSTWVNNHFQDETDCVVSRDKIRVKILKENNALNFQSYFDYEDLVFQTFINEINEALNDDKFDYVVADATHISKNSREKVFSKLNFTNIKSIILLNFDIPLETALERNNLRTGLERVPQAAIKKMYFNKTLPTIEEQRKWNMNVVNVKVLVSI